MARKVLIGQLMSNNESLLAYEPMPPAFFCLTNQHRLTRLAVCLTTCQFIRLRQWWAEAGGWGTPTVGTAQGRICSLILFKKQKKQNKEIAKHLNPIILDPLILFWQQGKAASEVSDPGRFFGELMELTEVFCFFISPHHPPFHHRGRCWSRSSGGSDRSP